MMMQEKIDTNGIVGAAVEAAATALQIKRIPPAAALLGLRVSEIPFALFCYDSQGRKVKMTKITSMYKDRSGEFMNYRYALRIWDTLCNAIEMLEKHKSPVAK